MVRKATDLLDQVHARWQPLSLILLAVILFDVALYIGFIRGYVKTSGDAEAIVASEQERLAAIQADVLGLERVASKLACTRSDVNRVFDETLSTKERRLTAIQRELRQLARDRRIDPDTITYAAGTLRQTDLVRLEISFPLQGNYETLESFIESVEKSKNFLIVENVGMEAAEGQSLRLSITLVTYFQPPADETPAAAKPGAGA